MSPRLLPLLLLLPCRALTQNDAGINPHYPVIHPRLNAGFGLAGGSLNFQQNGNMGLAFNMSYNILEYRRSSLSLGQGITVGTTDQYGISFPPVVAVLIAAGMVDYSGNNLDLSDGHRLSVYTDFPLLLHYNFGEGAGRRISPTKTGFYLGGGFTHTFTAYTNTFDRAALTDYWAWVADAGIRFRAHYGGSFSIGLGVEQPLRSPIGPIHNPVFFQLNFMALAKP